MIDSETGATAARHYRKPPALGAALGLLLASCCAAPEIDLPADGPDTRMMC